MNDSSSVELNSWKTIKLLSADSLLLQDVHNRTEVSFKYILNKESDYMK